VGGGRVVYGLWCAACSPIRLPSGFDDDVGSDGGARLANSTSQMMRTRGGTSRHIARPWRSDGAESGSTSGQFGKSGLPSLRAEEDSQNISRPPRLLLHGKPPPASAQRCTASLQRDMQRRRTRIAGL
jgi:hypothetical protein